MNPKKRMSRKKLTVVSLVTIPVVAGLGFAVTGPAFAGTNGQQLEFCMPEATHLYYRAVTVEGVNQNGERAVQDYSGIPRGGRIIGEDPSDDPDCSGSIDTGSYWKGEVKLSWSNPFEDDAPATGETTCNVPETSDEDVFTCFPPRRPSGS
jgi:hypothetical protein